MNDRTITRASRAGTKTVPIDHKPRPKSLRGNISLTPDELSTAMEMARADRIKQDIKEYARKKRAASAGTLTAEEITD